jgi:hypothetical protein
MLRRLVPYLALLLIPLVCLEVFAFLSIWLLDDLYDHREEVLPLLDEAGLAAFRDRAGDPVLGWASPGPRQDIGKTCTGGPVAATYDASGARVYPGYDPRTVQIVVVGDSYADGAEVDDDETFPAQLAGMLKLAIANHGVGGYGPLQAFLNLKQKIDLYPRARIAILAIMYENIYRMVNSYRPVLADHTSLLYGLKPHMAGGAIAPHPGAAALSGLAAFRTHAIAAFEQDFWAKPQHRFPYAVALLRALSSNYFWFREFQKSFRKIGIPQYFLAFRSPAITRELRALLDQYAAFAESRGLAPVVAFIPQNRLDTASASRFLDANAMLLDPDLVLTDVGAAEIAWERFNLEEPGSNNICHPTPYGYREIAAHLAGTLHRAGLVQRRPSR